MSQHSIAPSAYLKGYLSRSQVATLIIKIFGKEPTRTSRNFHYYKSYLTIVKGLNENTSKICSTCAELLTLDNFYANGYQPSGKKKYKSKCKSCAKIDKRININKIVTEYFGKYECVICSYNQCIQAIEFHHINPTEKEHNLSEMSSFSKNRITKELEKGILVCANCHREIHYGMHPKYLI